MDKETRSLIPNVPSPEYIISKGMNKTLVFYGCNVTAGGLIVYVLASAAISGASGKAIIDKVTLEVTESLIPTFVLNRNAKMLGRSCSE